MRHRRKGRRLGRSSSHRRALFRNLACALFLTKRDPAWFEGMFQADGKTAISPPAVPGRIVTTLEKAKEVRPIIERCITIARKALPAQQAAAEFGTSADRNTPAWKAWREGPNHARWVQAIAPVINARRRVFTMLRDKAAVRILFRDIAPSMEDRKGGYTRILRLAKPRLGDAGTRAILELVGTNTDRARKTSQKPEFAADDSGN